VLPPHIKPSRMRSLANNLPPFVEGRDRPVRIEEDGSIVYTRQEGEREWEAPRPITGYQQDSDNNWRFTPLWPECCYRSVVAVRLVNCGCLDVLAHCNNPESTGFSAAVLPPACLTCTHRGEEVANGLPGLPG
jgi:hypothetical protein